MLESVICTCQKLSELNKTTIFLLLIFHRVSRKGELLAQSETLCSWKAKLSTTEHGHQMDTRIGDHYVLGFAPTLRFLPSQILCRLNTSPLRLWMRL